MNVTYKIKAIALVIFMAVGDVLSTRSVALSESSGHFLSTAPVFAGISWGTDTESVQSQMIRKGYTFDADSSAKDINHSLYFSGFVQDTNSYIVEYFNQNRHLVGTDIRIVTLDEDCKSTFDTIVLGLTQKYGAPSSKKSSFQPPYTRDPSDFIPAIKQGKANFDVAWNQKGDYSAGVEARVNDDLTLLIIYNSPQGEAARLRRNSKPDPNL